MKSDERAGRRETRAEAIARRFIRVTGRISLSVFLAAFTAPALRRLSPGLRIGKLEQRRFEALAAVTTIELIHGLGIVSLLGVYTRERRELPPLGVAEALAGAVGYGMLVADLVSATPSFRNVSPRLTERVGQLADWYLYAVFSVDVLDGALRRGRPSVVHAPIGAALIGAGALRAVAAARGRT